MILETLKISIRENDWKHIDRAPKDGRLVFVRDDGGNVDLAMWEGGGWNYELGSVSSPISFEYVWLLENGPKK